MQASAYMRLNFTIAGAMALALMLAAIFVTTLSLGAGAVPAPAVEPQSGEESIAALMQGQPYDGPAVATQRGLDGKPDFTGVWRPVREKGKPGAIWARTTRGSGCRTQRPASAPCCTRRTTRWIRR